MISLVRSADGLDGSGSENSEDLGERRGESAGDHTPPKYAGPRVSGT